MKKNKIENTNIFFIVVVIFFVSLSINFFLGIEKAEGDEVQDQLQRQVEQTHLDRQYNTEDNRSTSYDAGDFFGNLDEISGKTSMPDASLVYILGGFLRWLLGIFGILSLIAFVISGIMYVTSSGDQTQIDKAKKAMTWSIVGVAVGLSGYIIIETINYLLGGSSY